VFIFAADAAGVFFTRFAAPGFGRERFGDEGHAREELVAESGSTFVCADPELALEPRDLHAANIESWLKILQNDKRAIRSAGAHAQRAADYLAGLRPNVAAEAAAYAASCLTLMN
jgi:antirestriction protein ArdC